MGAMRGLVLILLVGACEFRPRAADDVVDAAPDGPAAGAPGAPTGVSATPGDHVVELAWTAPADPGTSAIASYAATAVPDDPSLPAGTCTTESAATACTLAQLANGATYTITVTARNAAGSGPPSEPVAAMPIPALLADGGAEAGLELWLDAAATGTLELEDGAVTAWADRSPHARTATPSGTPAGPILEPAGVAGKPAVTFDGIDDALATSSFLVASTDYAIFAVSANRDPVIPIVDHVSVVYASMNCGANNPGFSMFTYNSFYEPIDERRPGVESGNAGSHRVRIDGRAPVTVPNGGTGAPQVTVARDAWVLSTEEIRVGGNVGGNDLVLGSFHNGCHFGNVSLGELLVFRRVFDEAELVAIEEYLGHKWRVALAP